jgi:hypothetical protein
MQIYGYLKISIQLTGHKDTPIQLKMSNKPDDDNMNDFPPEIKIKYYQLQFTI